MENKEKFPKESNEQLDKNSFDKNLNMESLGKKFNKEFDIDPDNIAKTNKEVQVESDATWNEKTFDQEKTESDLDFSGSELEEQPENKKKNNEFR